MKISSKNSITFTIIFEGQWWVGIFERTTEDGYSVAREIFGGEATEPQVYEFILKKQGTLRFSTPLEEDRIVFKKRNPKKALREARQTQNKQQDMSKAQDALRLELEKNKKQKKTYDNSDERRREKISI